MDAKRALPDPPPLRFVIVRLQGREFAVPASRVCGMMLMRTADLEPAAPGEPFSRRLRFNGRSIPVLEPAAALGLEPRPPSPRSCLLLIRSRKSRTGQAPADASFALAVDSISRIEDIPAAFYRPPGRVRIGDAWRDVIALDQLARADSLNLATS